MSENSGMTDAQAPNIGDSLRDVLGELNLITLGSESEREEFRNIRLRVMALANESDRLIAERDALRQWRVDMSERLGFDCAAGAQWTTEDIARELRRDESKLIADRDRLAAEVLRLQVALREVERHHVEQNALRGRSQDRSHTLRTVRAALSPATSTGSEVGK